MKKLTGVTGAVFITVAILVFATNAINWDETPLEHSLAMIPLGLGMMLELPFLIMGAVLTGNGSDNGLISYAWHDEFMQVMPPVAGMFYSSLVYLIATRHQQHKKITN